MIPWDQPPQGSSCEDISVGFSPYENPGMENKY